jgi:hypothetical protein
MAENELIIFLDAVAPGYVHFGDTLKSGYEIFLVQDDFVPHHHQIGACY